MERIDALNGEARLSLDVTIALEKMKTRESIIIPLLNTDCKDYKLAVKLINTYAMWRDEERYPIEKQKLFMKNFSAKKWNNLKRNWNFYAGRAPPIDIALYWSNDKFVTCIVKYNVNSIADMNADTLDFIGSAFSFNFMLLMFYRDMIRGNSDYAHEIRVKREIHLKFKTLFELNPRPTNAIKNLSQRGLRRIILMAKLIPGLYEAVRWIVDTVEVYGEVSMKMQEVAKSYMDCGKIYFRSIPDPSITKDEMREFLEFFCDHILQKEAIQAIADMIENLIRLKVNYEPRSLKHLCRISVRENLRDRKKKRAFPALVKDLDYPNPIKSYLLCER